MAAWVIPEIAQVTVRGELAGNPVLQVFHFRVSAEAGGTLTDREEALDHLADEVRDAWEDHMLIHLATAYRFLGVDLVDLDSADGYVTQRGSTQSGKNPGEPLPSNIAAVVHKNSNRIRGTRQGRFYLGGLVEASTVGNRLASDVQSSIQSGVDGLWSAVEDTGSSPLTEWDLQWCVVHTTDGAPSGVSVVTSFSVASSVSHQDRRISVR